MADDNRAPHSSNTPEFFTEYLNRTIMLLGEESVRTLRLKTVAIAGCGGQGGAACLLLARMGVGGFILADPKPFDPPDINRQWGAGISTLGRNKAEVYSDMLLDINPEIRIRIFCNGVTTENIEDFLAGADLLIDCLDVAVPGSLRKSLFASAGGKGLHIFTAAMLGFGGLIAGSCPGGLSLEVLGGIEDEAITGGRLPAGLRAVFVPEFMDRIEETLKLHRVPSIAVSPALLGTMLSVEGILALLGNTFPGWRPPVCLPRLWLIDLLRMNFNNAHIDELVIPPSPEHQVPASLNPSQEGRLSVAQREELLASAGYNTSSLSHDVVEIDLITDSWNEIPDKIRPSQADTEVTPADATQQLLQALYGYRFTIPVFRGRFAEALLCRAIAEPGTMVVTNAIFPSTRYHLESNGFLVCDLSRQDVYEHDVEFAFKGDLDLARLQTMLTGEDRVTAIYIEACVNATGGQPVSLGNLRAVRTLADAHGVAIALDAARVFENAVLVREREVGFHDRSLVSIVREFCALTDVCASSCSKDFQFASGGFIGTNHAKIFADLNELTLAFGDGLTEAGQRMLAHDLAASPESHVGPLGRAKVVRNLWELLRESVPVTVPCGGHGVFVDAGAMLPHIPVDQFPAQALANALFVQGGIRSAPNFSTPEQQQRGIQLLRLAVPTGWSNEAMVEQVARTFQQMDREKVRGLTQLEAAGGRGGEFLAKFRPWSA